MKYGVIEQMRRDYPVPPMCRLLGVSTSGYYAWLKRPPSSRSQQEPRLEAEILAAHQRTRETFGAERLQKDLTEHGVQVGVHRIKRLRKKLGLRCKGPVQRRAGRLCDERAHDEASGDAGAVSRGRVAPTTARPDSPHGPRQSILRSRVPESCHPVRLASIDEQTRKLF